MGTNPGQQHTGAGIGHSRKAGGSKASFVLRRMGAARLLPASLLLTVLISATVTTALASFGAQALPAGVRQRLASAPDSTVAISGQIGAATARADTPVIASSLRHALGAVPFTLISGRWSGQLGLPQPRGQHTIPLIQAADLGAVRAHTELTAGSWPGRWQPGQPIGVVLPVTTASLLRVLPGALLASRDTTTGAPVPLRVTGLFRPRDPAAAYWRLSLLGTSGRLAQGSFVTYGPALADPSAFAPGGLAVGNESWLATIDTARIHPAGIAALGRRLSAAAYSLAASQRLGGLQVTTGLPAVLAVLASSLVVTSSLQLIGWLELLLLAAAAAALAARLLASQREEETALLSARGVARGQLARASAAEASVLAVTGAAAGVVLGSYLSGLLMSASGLPGPGRGAGLAGTVRYSLSGGRWLPAAVIAVLVIIVMVWPALRPASPGAARARRGRQAALATVAQAGLDVALIGLAALAFWELHRYSAVPRSAGGRLGIDPVLVLAPALALAGAALIPLRLLPAGARLLDTASARGRRLRTALAGWQLSRRPQRQTGPVLLVVLAVGTGTLALAEHQSWRQSQLDRAAFAAGADVRVGLTAPVPLGRATAIASAPGVLSAMPVSVFNSGYSVFALDTRTAAATVLLRPDLSALPASVLWRRITPARAGPGGPGLVLPGRPARMGIAAMLAPGRGRPGAMQVTVSVQDGWGVAYSLSAGTLPADGRYHHLVVRLAGAGAARYPLRLLGLTLSYQLPGFPAPPYPSPAAKLAAQRAEKRTAAARSTLVIGALAVSARTSGPLPGAFTRGQTLSGWHAAATSAAFADPHTHGIGPAVTAWRASAGAASLTFSTGAGFLLEPAGTGPVAVSGQLALTAGSPALPVPAVVTQAFLAATSVRLGGIVPLPVGNITVPVQLVAAVRAFPTVGTGPAVIVDQGWLQEVLAARSQPPLPVTQWWLRAGSAGPTRPSPRVAVGAAIRAGLPAGATVTTWAGSAAALLDDPLPNVPQLSLLVIVIAAALLAAIGFAVSVAASVRERRLQDALLAALGVGKVDRAGQLCLEQLMLSLPAAAAGVLIGVVLAHLLAPAVTLTSAAAAPFPPVRVVVPLGWTALLALAIAAVPVLAAAASALYRPDPAGQLRAGERA